MGKEIHLLKNNDQKDWTDLQWVQEFHEFLTGILPEGMELKPKVKLSSKAAFHIIWYLQEHFSILPDHIEQCAVCGEIYDSDRQGYYSDLTFKNYCGDGCVPSGLYQKEERAEKRKDAPFQNWLKAVKKEQNNYQSLIGQIINESFLRNHFNEKRTPIDALNCIIELT